MDDLVTLEAYADENRALIHNGRNDEAIGICKHILHYYPKHIDSYRQLGEAYLEKDELDPAMDLFRRVLSADPENVIAYVGLASVFEKQHLIDEAVWHLERANEIAPGNFEIQKELLRLYSEAAKPRQRLKLTPGGLARLYDQEGLYSQAIQELRGITGESPARFDARVALAETLWHTGRIHESAETAQSILNSLPYCLKANLILGTAWKESGLPDHETYLNRAQELDPSNKTAHRLFGPRSPLAVTQVSVPRYVEGVPPPPMPQSIPPTASKPTTGPIGPYAKEPAVQVTDFFAETPTTEAETAGRPPLELETEPTPKPDLPGANLPPWLLSQFPESSEAASSTRTPQATAGVSSESETELPAWLKEQPSAEVPEATAPESTEPEKEKLPAWLEGSTEETTSISSAEEQLESGEPAPAEGAPDWLRALQAQSAPAEELAPAPPEETGPIEDYVMPGFLAPATEEAKPTEGQPAPDLPGPVAQEAPAIEEHPVADLAVEEQRESTAETPPAPPIVVAMPSTSTSPAPIERAPQIAAEMPAAAEPAAPTPKRKRQPKGYPHLVLAREHRDAGRTNDALTEYDYLVQHAPRLVNDVVDDLEALTAREDAPLEAHRILGDAYTRADRLAEALQRYQYVLERTSSSQSPVSNP